MLLNEWGRSVDGKDLRRLLNLKHDGSQSRISSTTTRSRHVLGERFLKLGIKDPAGLYSSTTMSSSYLSFNVRGAKSPKRGPMMPQHRGRVAHHRHVDEESSPEPVSPFAPYEEL